MELPAFLCRGSKGRGVIREGTMDRDGEHGDHLAPLVVAAVIIGALTYFWVLAAGTRGAGPATWCLTPAASALFGAVAPYRAWRWGAAISLPWLIAQTGIGILFFAFSTIADVFLFGVVNVITSTLAGGILLSCRRRATIEKAGPAASAGTPDTPRPLDPPRERTVG